MAPRPGRVRRGFLAAVLAALASVPALGGEATIEAVQWPAWIARDGRQVAAHPGASLQQGDRLLTGRQARLVIRLSDGSALKVGEGADLAVSSLKARDDTLQAALEVGKGAFRFTTGLFARVLGKREVRVRVSTLTIGIRGTDVWGKSTDANDLVLLLEGRVTVSPEGDREQELATPLDYLTAARGQPAERKSAVATQVAEWAKETEIDPGRPRGTANGRHAAQVAVAGTEAEALAMRSALIEAGYPARLRPLADGSYAVRVERLGSAKDAARLAGEARARLPAAGKAP